MITPKIGGQLPESSDVARNVETTRPESKPIGPMTPAWLGDNRVSGDLKSEWIKNGFVILRNVFTQEKIDRYNSIVARVRSEVVETKDEQGYGDRIGQLHQREPELLEVAAQPDILEFLDWAFDDKAVVFGSLNFERGTQQDAHIDSIFFWPEPCYAMAGVWIALEDIHPDAGPLFYLPGSHHWPFYHSEDVVRSRPELGAKREAARAGTLPAEERPGLCGAIGVAWTEELRALEAENDAERLPLSLKAGDVVVWHAQLAHGGSARANPNLSRRSAVFHYFGENAGLFTSEQFMLVDGKDLKNQASARPAELGSYKGRVKYMPFPYFTTVSEGAEIVHPLPNREGEGKKAE